MSAATMIACAANEIAMGSYSFLGPTDPQLLLTTHLGQRLVPAQAILDQFDRAQRESADPVKLAAWLPMLGQYGPDLLEQCEYMLSLSKELVRTWLSHGLFAGQVEKAEAASAWLSNHKNFKSHNRHIPRDEIRRYLPVLPLEDDKQLSWNRLACSTAHKRSLKNPVLNGTNGPFIHIIGLGKGIPPGVCWHLLLDIP